MVLAWCKCVRVRAAGALAAARNKEAERRRHLIAYRPLVVDPAFDARAAREQEGAIWGDEHGSGIRCICEGDGDIDEPHKARDGHGGLGSRCKAQHGQGAGVRAFDLRMVLNAEGGPTFHHGDVYWDTLAMPVFEEFRNFLLENPREIIVFSMINFAGAANNEAGHRLFVQSLHELFGDLIIPAAMDAPARTLDEIFETSGRLMVLYERGGDEGFWEHDGAAYVYPISRAYSNYDVSVNTGDRLDAYLEQEVILPVDDVKFIQAHLQYSQEVIQSNLAAYIEGYTIQETANERVLAWMVRHRDNPDGAIRIVDFDYFELF